VTGTANSVNLPNFIRIDFRKKMISSLDPVKPVTKKANKKKDTVPNNAKIKRQERTDGMLLLQGGQNGRAWSMAINEKSGHMTIAAAGDNVGFVVQGACISR